MKLKSKEEKIKWYEDIFFKKLEGRWLSCNSKVLKFLEENELFDLLKQAKSTTKLMFLKQKLHDWAYEEIPVCSKCKGSVNFNEKVGKYYTYCSLVCSNSDEQVKQHKIESCMKSHGCINPFQYPEVKEQIKETHLKKLGVDNPAKSKIIQEKAKQTCLNRYGVEYYQQTKEYKEKAKQTCLEKYGYDSPAKVPEFKEKAKQTCLEKYGVENYRKTKEYEEKTRKTCLEKYGVERYENSEEYKASIPEITKKQYLTRKQNNTFISSKPEEEIYQKLLTKFKNTQRNFKSELYPFACDFYIPELNLYIEYQGFWTHELEVYNLNNYKHQEKVKLWKQKSEEINFKQKTKDLYRNAIKIWTINDPIKRQTAKENNLNWIEFFSIKEFKNWFNSILVPDKNKNM